MGNLLQKLERSDVVVASQSQKKVVSLLKASRAKNGGS